MDEAKDIYETASLVSTRADFVQFVQNLRTDFDTRREEWENLDLPAYLDALGGFAGSIDGYYRNMGEDTDPDKITWRMAAQMLLAASVCE